MNSFNINGYLLDKETNQPIAGVIISLDSSQSISDSAGYFYINNLPLSNYLLSLRHNEYYPIDTVINIDRNVSFTFYLISNLFNLSGTILDGLSQIPVSRAVITLNNMSILSDSQGYFEFTDIKECNYVISIQHENYFTLDSFLTITNDTETTFELLQKTDYWPLSIGTE